MVAAGFNAGKTDQPHRSRATWKKRGGGGSGSDDPSDPEGRLACWVAAGPGSDGKPETEADRETSKGSKSLGIRLNPPPHLA
ncbi:hypothetical protein [Thiorhodovibrio winogradskyi]|uniref:hypothetical protein n=1 Tax=Thiorhodovibrio winogradskyi TaxID=77007 RepID=UPI0038B4D453